MKKLFFICLFCVSLTSFGQITHYPTSDLQNLAYLNILKVEITATETIIDMQYVCPYKDSSWICANKEFYINGVLSLERKKLIRAINIPICDAKYHFYGQGEAHDFRLVFQKLAPGVEKINIVEGYGPNQFNFYGVTINNPAPKQIANNTLTNNKPTINKPTINKPTNSKPTNSKPTNKKPTNSKPTNSKPTNSKPNTNISKVEQPKEQPREQPKLNFGTQKVGLKDSVNIRMLFDKASDMIKQESAGELQKLLNFMRINPTVVIELTGHTEADEVGYNSKQRASNLQLSIGRINSVREFLIAKGIFSSRIKTQAFGGSRPISPDPSINRRVVMRILKY
jgi:outer membrane protein OmpA-like peptidoglycan-associated protein